MDLQIGFDIVEHHFTISNVYSTESHKFLLAYCTILKLVFKLYYYDQTVYYVFGCLPFTSDGQDLVWEPEKKTKIGKEARTCHNKKVDSA